MKHRFYNILLNYATALFLLISITACSKDSSDPVVDPDPNPNPSNELREVFEFDFNETNGTVTYETNSGNEFSIKGTAVNRMQGVQGNSLFFDGLSNEVEGTLPTNLMPNRNLAVSLWASPKSYPVGTAAILALSSQGTNPGLTIGINKFGQIVVKYNVNGTVFEEITSESLDRNTWNHIAVGLTPAKRYLIIYLNNVALKTVNVPSGDIVWPSSNIPVTIGKNTMGEKLGIFDVDYFSGAIDDIKIYAGEATQENVTKIHNSYNAPSSVNYTFNIDYSDDSNRPTFHAIPDYGWANESYGLIYQGGKYHMFYQKNDVFLGIAQQNWGHFTSTDLVNWEEQNAVLWPTEGWDNFGIWSGCAIILKDGTPAVAYTGVDGVKAGIGTATSSDNYQTLNKNSSNPVIPSAPSDVNMDFRDPYIWTENNTYHMVVGSGISSIGGNIVYYSSADFENWTYGGIAYQGQKNQGEGQFWEMPVVYEFPNGKDMLLVQKTPDATPAVTTYWIGDFNNGVFTPDFEQAKTLEVVNGFLSPTVTTDTSGNITAIGIIPDEVNAQFQREQGWANLFSVPQVWTLDANNDIRISPHPNLNNLRGDVTEFNGLSIEEGGENYLSGFNGRHFEMEATINTGNANEIGFIFGKTPNNEEFYKVYYNMANQEWVVDASKSSLNTQARRDIRKGNYPITPGQTIQVSVFIDGSVLEVFVDNKAHFTGRFYPTFSNATGVDVFASGGTATADIKMYNINN
ncbi:GH32 C-terminal domain-containing protein [Jejuia pallidilutea]|uniref:beta-fructofuranosidase n=1 Tax=Jejuia pallidilutea TaxID=504487 RepID=A0A090W5X4_9FLAO|nr:GH32 C-terminal domain-containing protein [Jejuia pallidilutea]GAL65692.1 sucrose-6-phosphate hydrolase [Jejuia pallidilutea]GAL72410.1 sucrose-6-phosphate hydrolase [Jejuia pallidilutea]GAL88638.1 sucrose-6-phosphate hydrolase [Jejuia pallidilutea]